MRILHVVGKLDRGGAETWLVQTLRHIDRSKYQFDFLVHTEEPGAYDEEVKALGARIIPCLSPSQPVRYARNFLRILHEHGPYDCVHSHVHHFSGYPILIACVGRVPLRVAHSHTVSQVATPHLRRWLYLRTMRAFIRAFSTNGIAVTEVAADSLFPRRWRQDHRWCVQSLGVDSDSFRNHRCRGQIRESLGIPNSAFVVGHVGRFVEVKNHSFIVQVAAKLCRERENAFFLLVGDGPLLTSTRELVNSLNLSNRFLFTGIRTDVPDLLHAMDAFIFPSLYEGFGVAALEAQASGISCIASTGVPSEVDAGLGLFTRLNLDEPLETWIEHLTRVPAVRVPTLMLERFSLQRGAERLQNLYSEGLHKKGAGGTRLHSHKRALL